MLSSTPDDLMQQFIESWVIVPENKVNTMRARHLIDRIESSDFDIQLNVISGFHQLLRAIEEESVVRRLVELVGNDGVCDSVVRRIREMTQEPFDIEYQHPRDMALCVLLYVLQWECPDKAQIAAEYVRETPNLFWAAKMVGVVDDMW